MTGDRPAIAVEGLVKRYGGVEALRGVTFQVGCGEILALLGPNGAGKTTTVEILEGFRRQDAGTVRLLGVDPIRDGLKLKKRLGIMLQEGGLYPAITPREALVLFGRFYEQPYAPNELLAMVGLEDAAHVRFRRLSAGQKQRLKLALAILPRPEVLFLDEPTAGMDPQARRDTWEVIRRLRDDGATVMLTTHYLEEAEQLADTIAIIDGGRLVALDAPSKLIGHDSSFVRMRTREPVPAALLAAVRRTRSNRQGPGGEYIFETDDPAGLLAELAVVMNDAGIGIVQLRVGHGSLEEVFLHLTGKNLEE